MNTTPKPSRREYQREYKRKRRKDRPQVSVELTRQEREELRQIANRLEMSTASLLRLSALAYLNKTYMVPNPQQVARMEQHLSLLSADIRRIAQRTERGGYSELYWSYKLLLQKQDQLVGQISQMIREPRTLAQKS